MLGGFGDRDRGKSMLRESQGYFGLYEVFVLLVIHFVQNTVNGNSTEALMLLAQASDNPDALRTAAWMYAAGIGTARFNATANVVHVGPDWGKVSRLAYLACHFGAGALV